MSAEGGMTDDQLLLLLTVGRILRTRIADRERPDARLMNRHDAEDVAALDLALWPFHPARTVPVQFEHPRGYGYCPICGGAGVRRELGPNGNDICENAHTYASAAARPHPLTYDDRQFDASWSHG